MNYKNDKRNLVITTLIIILSSISTDIHAEKTKFELKKTIKKETAPQEEKPLFDLLNSNSPQPKSNDKNEAKWGNNPFFSQQPKMAMPEKKPQKDASTTMNLFEYKITAIWKVNNTHKALISGHIVKEGDSINELTVIKITEKNITMKRNNKKRTFRLGRIFYEFQI